MKFPVGVTFSMVGIDVKDNETKLKSEWAAYDSEGLPEEAGYSE